MSDGAVPLLIAIIFLIILSSFFSATETAFTSINVIKVKSLAQKEKKYKNVLKLYERYDKLLSTILIGNNVVNITVSTLSLLFFIDVLKNTTAANAASTISTAVITVVVLLFGEITPKLIAKAYPEKMSATFYPLIMFFYYIFYPLNIVLGWFKSLIGLIFKIEKNDTITDEELITIVNEAQEDGTLREEESDLIRSAIEFDDLEVKDILIPRINVVAISEDADKAEIKRVFEKERYSRLPVYRGNVDSIVGIIHEKDFYRNYNKKDFDIKDIKQDVMFVVEYTKVSSLLRKLQNGKMHMAVVLDEYGGTLGIVTVEDIIEELVGEIYDEHDEEFAPIKENGDNSFTVSGATELDTFFEYFDLYDEDEQFDTNSVGGWVTEFLSEIPKTNTQFEYKNLSVKVTKTTRKKVLEIKVIVKENEEEKI